MANTLVTIRPGGPFRGALSAPGDKSMAHRALIFAALANGQSVIRNLPDGADVHSTRRGLQQLGVTIEMDGQTAIVHGTGGTFVTPQEPIDCGNSGTTMRLFAGLLAGAGIRATLIGDESLSKRPMGRVADPLASMAAKITGKGEKTNITAPLTIEKPAVCTPALIELVSSAQVKSAMLLAGLYMSGTTLVREAGRHRDHTERMLAALGVNLTREGDRIRMEGPARPRPFEFDVPGDPSSAAFFAALAALVEGSEVTFRDLSINPTRFAFFDHLDIAGAKVMIENEKEILGEPIADVTVGYGGPLKPFDVDRELVPRIIDEIPLIGALACFASGKTRVRDAGELRIKESDRIKAICENLREAKIDVTEHYDGFVVKPGMPAFAPLRSFGDHRIAMAMAVMGTAGQGVRIAGADAVKISYPGFFDHMQSLCPDCSIEFEELL